MFNNKKSRKAGQAILEYTLIFVVVILALAVSMDKLQTVIATKAFNTMVSVCLSDNDNSGQDRCPGKR